MKQTIPFVYKWVEASTGMWYIGAHYKQGCHPDDGYLCSSKLVKKLISENPHNWSRSILQLCDTPTQARIAEASILQSLNARMDPMSYNRTNADGRFSFEGPHTQETRLKMKANHKDVSGENNPMFGRPGGMRGKKHKESSKLKTSAKMKGRSLQEETCQKISESLTGLTWINDGTHSRRINLQEVSLPEGWKFGLLEEHAQKMGAAKQGDKHWNYGQSHRESTKQKIAESLTGRTDSAELKLKKKLGSKKREKVKCEGCGKLYLTCHKRHHLKCV